MPADGFTRGRSRSGQGRARHLPPPQGQPRDRARASARIPFVTVDIDGQPRPSAKLDVGADQFSEETPTQPPPDRSRRRPQRAGGEGSAAHFRPEGAVACEYARALSASGIPDPPNAPACPSTQPPLPLRFCTDTVDRNARVAQLDRALVS